MATKKSSFSKKQKMAVETSESITLQTEKFLNSGGRIEQIQSGVSGMAPETGRKHITLTTRKKA